MADYSEQISRIETDTQTLKEHWDARNVQMKTDRDIINLVKPEKTTTDEVKWFSNEPKVFFDTSRALVSLYPPRFRLPISIEFGAEEKEKMNKAERLAIGIYRSLDQRVVDTGGVSWLWDLAYWVLLGWYAIFNVVQKTEDGVQFTADIWDPMTVYPEWDSNGLAKCIRTYGVEKLTAKEMVSGFAKKGLKFDWKEPSLGDKPTVINYWIKEGTKIKNAILIAGQVIKPLTWHKKLKRIPIHVGAIGSPDRVTSGYQTRRGESIIASNRDMYEYDNSMISLMAVILASQAFPNIIEKTRTGQPAHKAEEFRGYGTKLTYKIEDVIELLRNATTPAEANILHSYVGQQRQKGSVPNAVYGAIPFEVSGFALSQLLAAIKYKLGPYLNAMQHIISRVQTDNLYQYKDGGFGKITLSTENPSDLKRGMTYIEEFEPSDVPERIFVETTIPITSQFDKTQAILNSVQAYNAKLLSRETLWETELEVQDSEAEKARIREDEMMEDPFIKDMEVIERMWNRVEFYETRGNEGDAIKAEALKRYIMLKEVQLGIRQGVPEKAGAPGIPPHQMPPEARESPDQKRAATGTPPSGLRRRAQTSEERAASKGRRGILVSPSGQTLM